MLLSDQIRRSGENEGSYLYFNVGSLFRLMWAVCLGCSGERIARDSGQKKAAALRPEVEVESTLGINAF